jgi:hypothetical protein
MFSNQISEASQHPTHNTEDYFMKSRLQEWCIMTLTPHCRRLKILILNFWSGRVSHPSQIKSNEIGFAILCQEVVKLLSVLCTLCATKIKSLKCSKSETGNDVSVQLASKSETGNDVSVQLASQFQSFLVFLYLSVCGHCLPSINYN